MSASAYADYAVVKFHIGTHFSKTKYLLETWNTCLLSKTGIYFIRGVKTKMHFYTVIALV